MKAIIATLTILLVTASAMTTGQLPQPNSELTVSWNKPTEREDTSKLEPGELSGYILTDSCVDAPVVIEGEGTLSYNVPLATHMDCVYSIVSVDTEGLQSAPTDEVTFTYSRPNPPTNISIKIN